MSYVHVGLSLLRAKVCGSLHARRCVRVNYISSSPAWCVLSHTRIYSTESLVRTSNDIFNKGVLKTYSTQLTIKERERKRTCDQQCKVCLNDGAMIVAVAHACKRQCRLAHCHVTRLAGKWFVFAKKWKSSLARNDRKSSGPGVLSLSSVLSLSLSLPPPPTLFLSLSLSFSLSLSLSLALSFSLSASQSLAQGHKRRETLVLSSQRSSLHLAHWLCIQLYPPGLVRFVEHINCRKHALYLPTRSPRGFRTARKLTTCKSDNDQPAQAWARRWSPDAKLQQNLNREELKQYDAGYKRCTATTQSDEGRLTFLLPVN